MEIVKTLGKRIPILGVCLGHQAICAAYGARITLCGKTHARKAVPGRAGRGKLGVPGAPKTDPGGPLPFTGGAEETLPPELLVTARSEDGEVMAVQHRNFPVCGLQFHPESIMTPDGAQIIKNFLEAV